MKNENLIDATTNASNGLVVLFKEKAARREALVLIASVSFLLVEVNSYTLAVFSLSFILLALEAVNTAIEKLCDLHTMEFDERIRDVKDVAAAAIMLVLSCQGILLLIWYSSTA